MSWLDEEIKKVKTIAIAGHMHPDGDCIGSCLGMYNYILSYHKDAKPDVYLGEFESSFNFLANADKVKAYSEYTDEVYDLFIVLDCGDARRLGDMMGAFKNAKHTICIDHHESNNDFCDINHVLFDASSTCELVGLLISDFNKEIAECLYTGMVHDTGVFQYSCTSKTTMELAGKLMSTGIDYPFIVNHTFYEKSLPQQKILGFALQNAILFEKEKVVGCILTNEDLESCGARHIDLDGIAENLRNTREADTAIFIYQKENAKDVYKVSTRTKGDVNLAKIAVSFGGGGHAKAAGFDLKGDPKNLMKMIVEKVAEERESN